MIARARFLHLIALLLLLFLVPLSAPAQEEDVRITDRLIEMFETPEPESLPGSEADQECTMNLNDLGIVLEMYSADHGDRYPEQLSALVPDYLKQMISCPVAGADTYSAGYSTDGTSWTLRCSGDHHGALGKGYPRADSRSGVSPQEGSTFPFTAAAFTEEEE